MKINRNEKHRAREKLRHYVASGKIIKPTICTKCGKMTILHGHHFDYSKPLEVIWLCPLCHEALHHNRGPLLQADPL